MELPAHLEPSSAWHEIRAELRRTVGESIYDIWLAPLEVKAMDGAQLLLEAPPATQAWVAKRFGRIVETCARSVIGPATTVAFAATSGRAAQPASGSTTGTGTSASARSTSLPELDVSESFNPRYSFDQFIIGDGNRLAHAASLTVAEMPGQAYNPLFLHAPPGLGKTHLLHAIGNFVVAFGGGGTVRYTTVESFTNNFISALGSRSLERFKHAYRDADVLLIDDVHFLASKAKTEEEFFHTFNALYETGRQLVLTCDRLPRQLVTVEDRLRDRFESGLVADIRPPDFATRVAILRKRAVLDEIDVADIRVFELLAERVTDNVRTLEGALIRIVAHQSLTNRPLDLELATDVLEEIHPARPTDRPSIGEIQTAVASYYEISVEDLVSASRAARVAWPRQVAIHLARELTDASLQDIGGVFGGRNHATVLHACKRVSERVNNTPESSTELRELTQQLRSANADRGC